MAVIALITSLAVGGCDGAQSLRPDDQGEAIARPVRLLVEPAEAAIAIGDSIDFRAYGLTATGDSAAVEVTWSVTGGNITGQGKGKAIGHYKGDKAGTYSVVATDSAGIADTATVTVIDQGGIAVAPQETTIEGIGNTTQLQATAQTATGETVPGSSLTWTTLHPGVATVSKEGLVTAVADGTALITVAYQTVADTATIHVKPSPPPPPEGSPSVTVSPQEATLVGLGNTLQLTATALTATGDTVPGSNLTWTSLAQGVATVDTRGLVTGAGEGTALITVAFESAADTATIHVEAEPPPPPPPGNEEWDRVLANVTFNEDVVVPAGQKWLIGPNVQIAGNLRTVGGTIAMRPGSSLKFLGANPDAYVGGGMTFGPEFANDIGLWIGSQGLLDIRGTPKTGWNRTGVDPTWEPDDEYWITPTDVGDYNPRRWFPGDPIPQIDPRVPPAEVINVTRDIVIEGPGHIHIHSQRPQRIEYVQLRRMGVSSGKFGGPVLGRYALHLHFNGEGTHGTIIRGVAAVNSGGTVFVPHASHGISMIDNVSVNSFAEGLWWDKGNHTNDLLVDQLAVSGVSMPREVSGVTSFHDAITLGLGTNMEIRNSAASGVTASKISVGFDWPEASTASWNFHDNVGHNNSGPGIRFWENSEEHHRPQSTILYRNGGTNNPGVETGAYLNSIRYADVLVMGNRGILHQSSSSIHAIDGGPGRYERVVVEASDGPALEIGHRKLQARTYLEFIDCVLTAGPGAPKVFVHATRFYPWLARFIRSGVVPEDIVFESLTDANEGSHILIDHEDGRRWEIRVQNGQKVVRPL